jgi:hypothetical protein
VKNCYVFLVAQLVGLNTEQSIDCVERGLRRIERDINFIRLAARSIAQGYIKYLAHEPIRILGRYK